jgi:predicted ester cyclase
MNSERSAADTVRGLVDAWNSHDVERITAFFHDDFENWQLPIPTVRGLDAYRRHLRHWFAAYPDLHMEIATLFAEGDLVCLETYGTGTPEQSFFGTSTGVARENRALDVLELRDGKVWRQRGFWDFSLWTGAPSPLTGRPELRDAHAELTEPSAVPETGALVYAEFFRRLPGVSLDDFHRIATSGFAQWSRLYPQDELIANVGRTWRMGPYAYFLAWRCRGMERWDEWNTIFGSGDVDDIENPILDVMTTDAAGFYRELVPSSPAVGASAYYLETFAPWSGAAEAYRRRAQQHGAELVMLVERVGRLAPEPGGIALFALDALSDAARLQADVPPAVVDVGLYAPTGSEIL